MIGQQKEEATFIRRRNAVVYDLADQEHGVISVWLNYGYPKHDVILMDGMELVDNIQIELVHIDDLEFVVIIHRDFQICLVAPEYLVLDESVRGFVQLEYPDIVFGELIPGEVTTQALRSGEPLKISMKPFSQEKPNESPFTLDLEI